MSVQNKVENMVESISELSLLEACELVKALEKKFGVSASAPVAAAAAPVAAVVEEQTEYTVYLTSFEQKEKISIIKAIREQNNLGLKEAKDLVESAPCIIAADVSKEEANRLKAIFVALGAVIDIK